MTGERGLRMGTLIIAGQAGLAAAYHLQKRGLPFLVVDADERIGDNWRNRWDSLRLFSPAAVDGLPGMSRRAGRSLPDRSRDGRFPRGVRRPLRLPGHERHARGACPAGRGCSRSSPGREAAHRGRPGDRRDGRFPESTGPGGRVLARPRDPATPFERIPQPVPAPRRPRARRRPEPLRRRYRVRGPRTHRTYMSGKAVGEFPIKTVDTRRALLGWFIMRFLATWLPRWALRSDAGWHPTSGTVAHRCYVSGAPTSVTPA